MYTLVLIGFAVVMAGVYGLLITATIPVLKLETSLLFKVGVVVVTSGAGLVLVGMFQIMWSMRGGGNG